MWTVCKRVDCLACPLWAAVKLLVVDPGPTEDPCIPCSRLLCTCDWLCYGFMLTNLTHWTFNVLSLESPAICWSYNEKCYYELSLKWPFCRGANSPWNSFNLEVLHLQIDSPPVSNQIQINKKKKPPLSSYCLTAGRWSPHSLVHISIVTTLIKFRLDS